MVLIAKVLILVSSLLLWLPLFYQVGDTPTPEPLILTDEQGEYPLGLHLEILEDPGGNLSIEKVSSTEFDSQFIPSQEEVPVYGFTDSTYWVRLRLQNQTQMAEQWLLEVGFANMQYVDLYTPLPDGEGFDDKQTGSLRPVSTRDLLYPTVVFNLAVPTNSQQTYYLRFQSGASMTLLLTLWAQDAFFARSQQENILNWLFFGAIIALLVYHLFLLITVKETSYLFFVILLASMLLEELSYDGYLETYLFPNLYISKPIYYPLLFSGLIISIVLFSDAFLELRTRLPKLHWVNIVVLAGWGILLLLTPFARYHYLAVLMAPWAIFSLLVVLVAGIASWRPGFRPALFLMIAWLGMLVSIILVMLVRIGMAPSTLLNENIYKLGLIWMAVCWSLALADRINLLKTGVESANRDLRNSESMLAQILESLPLGVVLYGKDQKPKYLNQRTADILSIPQKGIMPDISVGRTLEQAILYFSLKLSGTNEQYPIERTPVIKALGGETASVDDIEMDRGDERIALEIQANPVWDDAGNVETAVVVFQDITHRKKAEAELADYRNQLEKLVEMRTAEVNSANEQLRRHVDWLSAINQVNQIMADSADFKQIYEKIIEIINELFSTQDSFIAEFDPGNKQLKIRAHSCHSDLHPALLDSYTSLPDAFPTGLAIKPPNLAIYSRDQLVSSSGALGMHFQVTPIQSITLVSLHFREKALGILGLEIHDPERTLTQNEEALLSIFAIDIAQLFENEILYEQTRAMITAEERNRLARDLHDSVTQVLFSITVLADVLPQIMRRDPEQGLQRLEKLRKMTRGALAEMRTMLLELRPSALAKTPLGDLLGQLTEAIASRSGLPFQLAIEQIPPLPENVQTNFYRIAQEALNNVIKHAQARKVTVSLSNESPPVDANGVQGQEVMLVVQDDGVGFITRDDSSSHLGMNIMRERAAAIQATLSIQSRPGYGTRVSLIWSNGSKQL